MRESTVLFESGLLRVRAVRCRAPAHDCGPIEWSSSHTVVLPETGVFLKHLRRHVDLVADSAHALFFSANQPYRVSHPVSGGDDCLVLELPANVLADAIHTVDPAAAESPNGPFRLPAVRLSPRLALRRRLLHHRLERRVADALEAEESAAEILRESARVAAASVHKRRERPRNAARHMEICRATQVTLAAQPSARWTLATLARRVDCSPFHLAHVFRDVVGMSIHQYQLRARLVAALDEVLDSHRGLSEIGIDLGFAHHSHFSDAFRRAFGMTPSALRQHATKSDSAQLRKFLTAP